MIEMPKLDEDLITIEEIIYSSHLIKAPTLNYYQIKEVLPQGYRMSTAVEELKIQLAQEKASKDLREAKPFIDLFSKDKNGNYIWQWTATGLRVPRGWECARYEIDRKGDKRYPRIVLIDDNEVGEVLIPGDGFESEILEWDEVFGLPLQTREYIPWSHKSCSKHFLFNVTPDKDTISGRYDVSIGRGSYWLRDIGERCVCVLANYGRSAPAFFGSFRPVRASLSRKRSYMLQINDDGLWYCGEA